MAEDDDKARLDKEVFNYIRLGTILKKKRSPSNKEAVEKIIGSNLGIADKIREIGKIDGEADSPKEALRGRARTPKQGGPTPSKEAFYKKPDHVKRTVIDAIRNRNKLKVQPAQTGFLSFVLHERVKFLEFSRTSCMINVGFLGLFPRINRSCVLKLGEGLKTVIIPKLRPVVSRILDSGWRQLDKIDYNLVAALNRLLEEVAKVSFNLPQKSTMSLSSHFFLLENTFLFFYTKPDFIKDLIRIIETSLSMEPDAQEEATAACGALKILLYKSPGQSCLYDLILALSMLNARRALTLATIISTDSTPLISTQEFDCSQAVQKEIDAHINTLVQKIEPLAASHQNMDSSARFIPCDSDDTLDLSLLFALLGENAPEMDRKADAGKLCCVISDRYVEVFGKKLNSDVATFSMRTVRLMPEGTLSYEMGRLDYAKGILEKQSSPLSFARFKEIKMGVAASTQFEAEIGGRISEIASLFHAIGVKLSDRFEYFNAARTAANASIGDGKTIEISPLDEVLADQGAEDLTMGQWITTASQTAFIIAGYFMNQDVLKFIQNKRKVRDEIGLCMRTLERLALVDESASIREHFGLLGY